MTDDNVALWNAVCETNPNHTRKVAYGKRRFTAICAYSQIHRATQMWGPMGIGWGAEASYRLDEGMVICELRLWYDAEKMHTTPMICGAARLKSSEGTLDTDAHKKAFTDALTKSLSLLGFNADVFEGRFDDVKYVQEMTSKYQQGSASDDQTRPAPDKQTKPDKPAMPDDPNAEEYHRRALAAYSAYAERFGKQKADALMFGQKTHKARLDTLNLAWQSHKEDE